MCTRSKLGTLLCLLGNIYCKGSIGRILNTFLYCKKNLIQLCKSQFVQTFPACQLMKNDLQVYNKITDNQ